MPSEATISVCPLCLAPARPEFGEVTRVCDHYNASLVEVQVTYTLDADARDAIEQARWSRWLKLWDDCEARRGAGLPPYLDPDLDWTPAGRRARHARRRMPMMSVFTQAMKDVWSASPPPPSNYFTIPIKYSGGRGDDEAIDTRGATAEDFTRVIEHNAPVLSDDDDGNWFGSVLPLESDGEAENP